MNIGIVGLGLIGWSIGLKLQRLNHKIYGVTNNNFNEKKAIERKLANFVSCDFGILKECSLIILALPIKNLIRPSNKLISVIQKEAIVTDVDSIKEPTVTGKGMKRKRSVWNINTSSYKEAHFAVYPEELITPAILSGSEKGDIILDPFMGSGTTAKVAKSLGRYYLGCELNESYGDLINKRVYG